MAQATHSKLETAIHRLQNKLTRYDELETDHAELTRELTEAKKACDEAARLVVRIDSDPQTELPLDEAD